MDAFMALAARLLHHRKPRLHYEDHIHADKSKPPYFVSRRLIYLLDFVITAVNRTS
jgi:hypothetical protein